jgi:hypothetical protein
MTKIILRLAGCVWALWLAAAPLIPASAQAGVTFFITDVDCGKFPSVSFRLRAVDLNNKVARLNNADVAVYENGQQVPPQNVSVTPHEDGPINIIFLIDQGQRSNFQSFGIANARQALTTLVDGGYFIDGLDSVMVMVRENQTSDRTETRFGPAQTGAELTTWVASYPFERRSVGPTRALEGVTDAIGVMNELVPIPGSQATAIVLLTRFVEDPNNTVAQTVAQNKANDAKLNYISIFTLQTDLNQTNNQPLQLLASASNGSFVPLNRNTVPTSVAAIYQSIDAQRLYYTVAYSSTLGTSDARTLTINSTTAPTAGASGSCQVAPLPPAVSIEAPTPGSTVQRLPQPSGVYNQGQVKVIASVEWPDGFPRSLQSAELLINGTVADKVDIVNAATRVEFDADISNITQEGPNQVQFEVRVKDTLGLEGSAQVALTVEVAPLPTATPVPASISDVAVPAGIAATLCAVLAVVLVLGGVVVYLFTRRPVAQPSAAQPAAAVNPAEFQNTIIGGQAVKDQVLATLTVLEGPRGLIGETLRLVKPTSVLGRNPRTSDVTFYADEESSVSRIHCTLQKDADRFKLTDNGSSSGTRLNGRQIRANDPVVLTDGDEITLGDLAKRGVKLRFNSAVDQGQLKFSGGSDDRTMIINPPEEDVSDRYTDN